ncbi:MAG: IS4 family transposase [Planctomycetaceae bacterium]|nr:IS4 family transposase [Planctomycetaceae bacterium]
MFVSGMQAAERVSSLSVLVRGAVERWLAPEVLAEVARASGGANYERKITLEALTALMLDAVLGMQPSVHAAAVARRDEWQGSVQALYGKLARVDPRFSAGLVRRTAAGILRPASRTSRGKRSYAVKILDGTMPDGSEHRLSALRGLRAAGLPAKAVVVYDLATGVCERAAVSEDAYTGEKPLAETLVEEARPGELYVGDRGFCTVRIMGRLIDRGAAFVFRELAYDMVYDAEGPELRRRGSSVGEAQVGLRCRERDCTWPLRRIHVRLDEPTREGDREVRLLTNLPTSFKARDVAELYRRRWAVERYFHLVKRELHGQLPSLGEPRAALFALCAALAAGNVLAWIKSLTRGRRGGEPALSGYYLALEISRGYAAVETLAGEQDWQALAALSDRGFQKWAARLADAVDWSRYVTHPRGPKHPPPKRTSGKQRHHYSTYRLLHPKNNESNAC